MLATAATKPGGEGWIHEVKWDGMRVLAEVTEGKTRLYSRTGRDITVAFPELTNLSVAAPDILLDGEIIALSAGVPSFEALADRMHVADPRRAAELAAALPVSAMVFDVLRLYGVELLMRPLAERRATLDKIELPDAGWTRSPSYPDGSALLDSTRQLGLEGMVSKRLGSSYQPGRRSLDWIKIAHRHHQSCVVGGWRPETGNINKIGALLIGVPDETGALRYCGRVGSGIDHRTAAQLLHDLTVRASEHSPFSDEVGRIDADGARYAQPGIVIEVRHLGWTTGHRLRQPVFRGIRTDLDPATVRREN
jgi:bifunctional non-homologous end joining protein LigD